MLNLTAFDHEFNQQ